MHILHVVGARPNFMKAAPVVRALAQRPGVRQTLVHTGQHYDFNMSDVFFQQLEIPAPDVNLQAGSGSHAQQTAEIISRFEPVILERKPDCVLVYGDVNSTVAAALVCSKLMVPIGHVEAGLRSFDRAMPEEINRLLTDQVADLLFTPSADGNENLAREGVAPEKVHLVGNVMIDTLVRMLPAARTHLPADLPERYVLVTLHRPSNVDDLAWLGGMLNTLAGIASELPVWFPIHPRTRQRLADAGISAEQFPGIRLLDPIPYLQFLGLQTRATVVITDSGGIQEETTFLGRPCLTVRENTERPVTVDLGTNVLVGRDTNRVRQELECVLAGRFKKGAVPPLWDGKASERIADVLTGGVARG
ncbi:MAG: non-hydrolyzing UDP-N-acetylglucosamine 2-epimerase [Thermomicrobiales bacterium]